MKTGMEPWFEFLDRVRYAWRMVRVELKARRDFKAAMGAKG